MPWSVAFMVVMIVIVVSMARVSRERYRAMGRAGASGEALDSAETMRVKDEVRQLRERVQVLERVITDGRNATDLDHEIERLRDR